jgi:deoxyadenosine/deoxycytidine kinase
MLFTIEGNIGSGKSTIIHELKNTTDINGINVIFVDEPVHIWETIVDKDGVNMIEKFYSDPVRYSFTFQMMAFISRYTLLNDAIEANPNSIIITERCLLTDYNIFAKMLHEKGDMSDIELDIYKRWFDYFNRNIVIAGIIYIKCEPTTSHERCVHRNRKGEIIPLEYIVMCHEKHEEWLDTMCDTLTIENTDCEIEDVVFEIIDFISDQVYENFEYNELREFEMVVYQQSSYLYTALKGVKDYIVGWVCKIDNYILNRINSYLN